MRRLDGIAAMAVLGLASCGPNPAELRHAQLQTLVGQSELQAVQALGVPSRSIEVDGRRFLQWDQISQFTYPAVWGYGWGPPWYGGVPPSVVTYTCQTMLEIGQGKVLNWQERGTGC